jgi:two-component system sensor histidine kinase ChvG
VRCVESRIGQVIRNLLANAVSFSPAGGTIRVTVQRVGAVAEVAVEDQGPGVPADKLTAVFDRFYSLRPENEPFGMHSGLGLSISKQIVEAHGGTIRAQNIAADSPAGGAMVRGARFVFTLPLE